MRQYSKAGRWKRPSIHNQDTCQLHPNLNSVRASPVHGPEALEPGACSCLVEMSYALTHGNICGLEPPYLASQNWRSPWLNFLLKRRVGNLLGDFYSSRDVTPVLLLAAKVTITTLRLPKPLASSDLCSYNSFSKTEKAKQRHSRILMFP